MFCYRVYGLSIASSIPIEGPAAVDCNSVDCRLTAGLVERLDPDDAVVLDTSPLIDEGEPGTRVEHSRAATDRFVFEFLDGTRFRIEDSGNRVIAHFPGTTSEDMATYFLGPILAFIVRLRGTLALHAGAVVIDGGALLISGVAGAGKSTTTAALLARGALLLTDDVAVIDWRDADPRVFPGYPRVRLWDDSAASLYGAAERLPLLTPTWSKRYVDARGQFVGGESIPVRGIVVLGRRQAGPSHSRRLTGHEAAMALLVRTSITHLLTPLQRRSELDQVARFTERVPVVEVTPRDDLGAVGELLDTIAAALL